MDRIIREANWYCMQTNQRLRIEKTTLPELNREMMPTVLGRYGLELPAEIKSLTCEQEVNGLHEDLKGRFGREPGDWTELRYYQSLLNVFPAGSNGTAHTGGPQLTGRITFIKCLLETFTEGEVKGMKASPTKLKWSSVVLYHDIMDGKTIHKFDIQNGILIINGVNYTAEHNRLIAA